MATCKLWRRMFGHFGAEVFHVIYTSADSDAKPEVCIIELGGTIGDIEGESANG